MFVSRVFIALASLILCFYKAEAGEKICLLGCPPIHDPICAWNGKIYQTFDNICLMEYENCIHDNCFSKSYNGKCYTPPRPYPPYYLPYYPPYNPPYYPHRPHYPPYHPKKPFY
ncbi:uncharacterized protein LOC111057688 [Nilaparvata lugens]|uniref:uncharacterized protein LOC111057688 n=1 Tax=Nilaparvata lugens TaxID=108931 RepID=UPI000B986630|nr:uncharacterized protein LOC111057688 [Nilaparvata lugens]